METGDLYRYETGDQGTFSDVQFLGFECQAIELPWRNNQPEISCIPAGTYLFQIVNSPKHGRCYEAEKVKDRTNIQIHSANFAGDATKGWKSELLGCIALGRAQGSLAGQKAILASKDAIHSFMQYMDGEPFTLSIHWNKGIFPSEEQKA